MFVVEIRSQAKVTPHFVGRPNVDRILPPDFLEGGVEFRHLVSGWIGDDAGHCCGYQVMSKNIKYILTEADNVVGAVRWGLISTTPFIQ